MAGRTPTAIVLIVVGAALAGFGLSESGAEFSPYLVAGYATKERFAAISADLVEPGDSRWSKDLIVEDCLRIAGSLFARAQPPARRAAFLDNCRRHASGMTSEMPTYSAGWLAKSVASALLSDFPDFNQSLIASQMSAPSVGWLLEQRVNLAVGHRDYLSTEATTAYHADLMALFSTDKGRSVLASLYVAHSEERDTIIGIGEQAPVAAQQDFLDRVRQLVSARL